MNRKNRFKAFSVFFMLFAMIFSCTQVSENINESNSDIKNNPSNDSDQITIRLIGADGKELKSFSITAGERVALTSVLVEKLSHWNTKADGSGLSYREVAVFTESVTLYAILLADNAHLINYVLNGGVNNPQNPYSFTEDDNIELKNPTRDDYTFIGWYGDRNFSGKATKGWSAGDKTGDVTLYAKWEKEDNPAAKITITFDANGGSAAAPEKIETTSDKITELPSMTASNFSHWNTKADGSGVSYNGDIVFTESITLYAIYLKDGEYKIIYHLNGGVNNPQNPLIYKEKTSVQLQNPTREGGYVFIGWYENEDFLGEPITGWQAAARDVELWAKWDIQSIYSYTVKIDDISTCWGGSTMSPSFSIMLLTDAQLEACKTARGFKVAPAATPEYQVGAYGNMKLADTSDTGDFAPYGQSSYRYDVCQYYTGVAATVTETTLTVTVDMTKLKNTDLKALWEGDHEAVMRNEGIVDLTGYKPYVLALANGEDDPDNHKMSAWSADLMAMAPGATFPTGDLKKVAPTFYNLKYYTGTMTARKHVALTNNGFAFTAAGTDEFIFTGGDLSVGGVTIDALDQEIRLKEENGGGGNNFFVDGVLTEGEIYEVTLIVEGPHEAYVKVSELNSFSSIEEVDSSASAKIYGVGTSSADLRIYLSVTTENNLVLLKKVTADMVSDFDSSTVGTKTLTITYEGKTTTFDIEIIDTNVITAANVADYIFGLAAGKRHTVAVTGVITSDTIQAIETALKNSTAEVDLDLSQTTGLTEIGDYAFWGCSNLTSVIIGSGVTSIGNRAFYGCSGLTSVTIPNSVTSIGRDAFSNCSSLTSITVDNDNPNYSSQDGILYSKDKTKLICVPNGVNGAVTIPDSVTSIGDYAFFGCSGLTSITIDNDNPNYSSQDGILYNKDKTKLICVPEGVNGAVTIPDSVTSIDDYAFWGCSNLTSVTIPDSVTSIGDYAFSNCPKLTSVTFENTSNWYCTTNSDYTGGEAINVTNSARNATNLKSGDWYWYRK